MSLGGKLCFYFTLSRYLKSPARGGDRRRYNSNILKVFIKMHDQAKNGKILAMHRQMGIVYTVVASELALTYTAWKHVLLTSVSSLTTSSH